QEVYDVHAGRHGDEALPDAHQPFFNLALHGPGLVVRHVPEDPGPPLVLVEELQVPALNLLLERCHRRNLPGATPPQGDRGLCSKGSEKSRFEEALPGWLPCPKSLSCKECRRQDLTLHEVTPPQALNLARLPIPPLRLHQSLLPYAAGPLKSKPPQTLS